MAIPMTKSRAAEVARQYEAGKSIDTLIAEYKSSYYSVRKAILDHGVKLRPSSVNCRGKINRLNRGKPPEWTAETMELAIKTYEHGSLADVAEATGFSKSYVALMLKAEGVPIRTAHKTFGKRSKPGNTKDATVQKLYDFSKYQSISLRVSV